MSTGVIAALLAALVLGVFEGFGRFYPSKRTWLKLRSRHGRRAVRAMRERFEAAAERRAGRNVAVFLGMLILAWVASASLLDKRWYEVVLDVLPYAFVLVVVARTPTVMRKVGERMKELERGYGEDPDAEGGDGPTALAL